MAEEDSAAAGAPAAGRKRPRRSLGLRSALAVGAEDDAGNPSGRARARGEDGARCPSKSLVAAVGALVPRPTTSDGVPRTTIRGSTLRRRRGGQARLAAATLLAVGVLLAPPERGAGAAVTVVTAAAEQLPDGREKRDNMFGGGHSKRNHHFHTGGLFTPRQYSDGTEDSPASADADYVAALSSVISARNADGGTNPSASPSAQPSMRPSLSKAPSPPPSEAPSGSPSASSAPSSHLSGSPSAGPSTAPSDGPSAGPTASAAPSSHPSAPPSAGPSSGPSSTPTLSSGPSSGPSLSPTVSAAPSVSSRPSGKLSSSPSRSPSSSPISAAPTVSARPSRSPSLSPSSSPTSSPSVSAAPSVSSRPSAAPTTSTRPSSVPSSAPSSGPSGLPTISLQPSSGPSTQPSADPSQRPSSAPSSPPTASVPPSSRPSTPPSSQPSGLPTVSSAPSDPPSISHGPTPKPTERPISTSYLTFKHAHTVNACRCHSTSFVCQALGNNVLHQNTELSICLRPSDTAVRITSFDLFLERNGTIVDTAVLDGEPADFLTMITREIDNGDDTFTGAILVTRILMSKHFMYRGEDNVLAVTGHASMVFGGSGGGVSTRQYKGGPEAPDGASAMSPMAPNMMSSVVQQQQEEEEKVEDDFGLLFRLYREDGAKAASVCEANVCRCDVNGTCVDPDAYDTVDGVNSSIASLGPDRPELDLCVTPTSPDAVVSYVDIRLERDGVALPPPQVSIVDEQDGMYRAKAILADYDLPAGVDPSSTSPLVVRGSVVVTCGGGSGSVAVAPGDHRGAGLNFAMAVPFDSDRFPSRLQEDGDRTKKQKAVYGLAIGAVALSAAILAVVIGHTLIFGCGRKRDGDDDAKSPFFKILDDDHESNDECRSGHSDDHRQDEDDQATCYTVDERSERGGGGDAVSVVSSYRDTDVERNGGVRVTSPEGQDVRRRWSVRDKRGVLW